MDKSNSRKRKILGIPFGTATSKLKKNIMFNLVKKCKEDICYVCSKKIKFVKDFSVEHKIPWESTKNKKLFWDFGNIAFSHSHCNTSHSRPLNKKVGKAYTLWCTICKKFLSRKKNFVRDASRWTKYSNKCRKCFDILRRKKLNSSSSNG